MKKELLFLLALGFSPVMKSASDPEVELVSNDNDNTATEEEYQNLSWHRKAVRILKKNKGRTATTALLTAFTIGGFASDFGAFSAYPDSSVRLTALPGNGRFPTNAGDCFYTNQTDCMPADLNIHNLEQCQEYLEEDGNYYLQSCFNDIDDTSEWFAFGSMKARLWTWITVLGSYKIFWRLVPWEK